MDIETITIDRDEARKKVAEYRELRKSQWADEDALIARGYLEAAEGRQLIQLPDVLRAGGLDERGLPRLAVARADMPWCYLGISRNQDHARARFVGAPDSNNASNVSAADRVIAVTYTDLDSLDTWEKRDRFDYPLYRGWRSQVPHVPPALRPTRPGMHAFHVLWEVDQWARDPIPSKDPALIRRIGGDLWAVYAMWDLTDLERAVLSGRT